jgi:hypothetical protein
VVRAVRSQSTGIEAGSTATPPGRLDVGFLAAALMAACSALHVVGAADAAGRSGLHVLVLLAMAMAMACLPCAVHVVLVPAGRMWLQAMALAGGMLAVHGVLALIPGTMTVMPPCRRRRSLPSAPWWGRP